MMQYGYLFNWDEFSRLDEGEKTAFRLFLDALDKVPQFNDVSDKHGASEKGPLPKRWSSINFRSSEALAGEDPNMFDEHVYRVLVRANPEAGTVLFAAKRYKIVEAAVATFNAYTTPRLQRKPIRVAGLSETLLGQEGAQRYYVTFLLADVPGYGDSLRTISLAGDDLAGAQFFDMGYPEEQKNEAISRGKLLYKNFTARQIGLRPTNSLQECGRFGSVGTVQFQNDAIHNLENFFEYARV